VIIAERLTKRYGSTLAVNDVSFEVVPGQVTGFLGHNGAGKTTTLSMVLGLIRPTAGSASVLGRPYGQLDHPLRRIGVMLEPAAHPGRSGRDHLRVAAAAAGASPRRIEMLLEVVGLARDSGRRIAGYSQGMRQRLGIATALLADPEVIILDEPTNGLDPDGIRWLRDLLQALAGEGRTVLLSSHQLAEVAQTVQRVIVMDRGMLINDSSLEEVVGGENAEVHVRSPGAEVLAAELQRSGITVSTISPRELRAKQVSAQVVSELAARLGIPIWEVHTEAPTLEEAFFELTSGERNGREPETHEAQENERRDGVGGASRAERRLDRELDRLPVPRDCRVVAVGSPSRGLGTTTVAFLLAETAARTTRLRTLAVALSLDRERMSIPAAADQRAEFDLTDLLSDLPEFDRLARIAPYVSVTRAGAHTLRGPRTLQELQSITSEQLQELLSFVRRHYELVVLDLGELSPTTLRAAVSAVDEVVLLSSNKLDAAAMEDSPVIGAVEELRSERATLVANHLDPERFATVMKQRGGAPYIVLPEDRHLARALDAGSFALSALGTETRVAIKEFTSVVLERLA